MPIFLKHIDGGKTGLIETFDEGHIRIGRQPDNDLKFDPQIDASVSGYHAEIYRDGESFFIKDLQSRNGTFVNSRKIDQSVPLQDGDIIQFSARGPKVVFSTRDPSLAGETAVMNAGAVGSTGVVAAEEKPKPDGKLGIWEKIQYALPIAGAIVALLALVGLGRYLGFSWWGLLVGSSVVLLVTGGAYVGWRYWKRRKALQEQKEVARQEREASLGRGDRSDLQEIRRKWTEVVRSLRDSKLSRTGDEPIYALPWFVMIGEPGSGKSALIKASGPQSSVTGRGQDGPTRNCDWWFFDKLLVLDTSGRYAFQAKGSDSAGEWQELVNLLRTNRRREPVNGVLIALPADSLASRPVDKLKEQAAQLRERLDEMAQRLGVKFPVYLAITKSDFIAGFKEFFEALPDQVKGQAMGYVNSETVSNADAARFFEKAFRTMCERAERLRLAMVYEEGRDGATGGIFLFPAELRSLHSPLKAFVEVLFRPSPYRDAPFFRGLFLTSSRQAGSPLSRLSRLLGLHYAHLEPSGASRDLFLRDLFAVILPNDRALVGSTVLGRERSQLTRAAGLIVTVAAALLLCGLFTLSFTNNWLALRRLDLKPCTSVVATASSIPDSLRTLDGCRASIETLSLDSIWQKLAYDFGLRQTDRIEAALQKRFSGVFRANILKPLDDRLDQSLASETGNPLVVGSVIQRIHILARCREVGRCSKLEESNGLNYRIMLSVAQPQLADGDPAIEHLRRTHNSYLLWQSDSNAFAEMYSKDLERIRGWVDRGGLRLDRVLQSAKAQFPAIRAADFWGINAAVEVDAAYTARAWRDGISPLISGLQKMPTETSNVGSLVRKFEATYRNEALREWGAFLAAFPQVEQSAFQRRVGSEFASNVSSPQSPFNRVIDVADANLSIVLGSDWGRDDLPPWAVTLRSFAALKGKIQQAQKAGKTASDEKTGGKEAEAASYLVTYLDALSQLRTEFSTTKKAFESSDKAFQEGEPSSKAAHPILKASWALNMLKDKIGSPRDEDRQFWILLTRPISLAWRAMLEESGKYLQQQWEGLLSEVRELDPGSKGGKAIAFATNGSAAAFLYREGPRWVARERLNQSIPFTETFLQYLSRVRDHAIQSSSPKALPGPEPPSVIVRTF
jgi:type VI secretion system protein ImpL